MQCKCNVNLRKLLSAHTSHIRETSLFTGAISNPFHNSQTSRFVSVPGQNLGRSSQGDSVVLRLQSVMMADVWWCRSGTGVGYALYACETWKIKKKDKNELLAFEMQCYRRILSVRWQKRRQRNYKKSEQA